MAASTRRILLVTSAYPDADHPLNAPWNAWQMEALRSLGCETRVFLPTTWVPRAAGCLSSSLRRKASTPARRVWNEVEIISPRVLFGFQWARLQSVKRPGLVVSALRRFVQPTLVRALQEWAPTGIIVQGGFPWGPVLAEALTRLQPPTCPFILVEHSMFDLVKMQTRPELLAFYRVAATAASSVVVVGPQMVEVARELGLPRVAFVPNGAHPPAEEMRGTSRPQELRNRFIILCVTNYYRKKGIEELVDAFERAAADHPDALLIIVTAAPDSLRERIAASPLASRILLRGALPNDQVRQLMVWSDLFAMISWEEAFGIVYTEALMAGCPVLMTTECGAAGIFPVAAPGDAGAECGGLVIPPRSVEAAAEALRLALGNRALMGQMGDSGRHWALASLSWPRHAEGLLAALDRQACSYDGAGSSSQG
jgi:glycosyltransferase involved in cell wall biosynthesis